jgi:hypothetical protein
MINTEIDWVECLKGIVRSICGWFEYRWGNVLCLLFIIAGIVGILWLVSFITTSVYENVTKNKYKEMEQLDTKIHNRYVIKIKEECKRLTEAKELALYHFNKEAGLTSMLNEPAEPEFYREVPKKYTNPMTLAGTGYNLSKYEKHMVRRMDAIDNKLNELFRQLEEKY